MAEWEAHSPQGENIKDRMMDVVSRYMGETVNRTQGMERMMAQQAANRMYPRIEQWVRTSTDEELKNELRRVQQVIDNVIGEKPAKAAKGKSPKSKRAGKARKVAKTTTTRKGQRSSKKEL